MAKDVFGNEGAPSEDRENASQAANEELSEAEIKEALAQQEEEMQRLAHDIEETKREIQILAQRRIDENRQFAIELKAECDREVRAGPALQTMLDEMAKLCPQVEYTLQQGALVFGLFQKRLEQLQQMHEARAVPERLMAELKDKHQQELELMRGRYRESVELARSNVARLEELIQAQSKKNEERKEKLANLTQNTERDNKELEATPKFVRVKSLLAENKSLQAEIDNYTKQVKEVLVALKAEEAREAFRNPPLPNPLDVSALSTLDAEIAHEETQLAALQETKAKLNIQLIECRERQEQTQVAIKKEKDRSMREMEATSRRLAEIVDWNRQFEKLREKGLSIAKAEAACDHHHADLIKLEATQLKEERALHITSSQVDIPFLHIH